MRKHLLSGFALLLLSGLSYGQSIVAEKVGASMSFGSPEYATEEVNEGTLYSNGPYYNVEGSPNVSFLQDQTLGLNTYGFGHAESAGYRVADDWEVTQTVSVESIQFYAYQTGSGTNSTINFVSLAIWDGHPGDPTSSIVWGDQFDDFLTSTTFTGAYRQLESSPGDTSRPIMIQTLETPGLVLEPGTYWLDWNAGGTLSSGPWAPPIVITGESFTGNALQYDATTNIWSDLIDLDPQGLPFEVNGTTLAGVNDLTQNAIAVFPNPASNMITITGKSSIQNVSVYNLAGQEVMKSTFNSQSAQLNISSLEKGNYILKATVDGKVQTVKFVKK